MKVLHVITSLCTGGAEKLMVDLLPGLQEKNIDVEICVFNGKETLFMQQLKSKRIRIHNFGTGRSVYHPANILKLWRLIKNGKYDIVHTHNTAPQLFGALISMLCSVVLCTTEHTTSNRRRDWKWYVPIDRWMYSRYNKIICCSEKTKQNLCDLISTDKCVTINNGINIKVFQGVYENSEFRSSFPLSAKLITMVAGFRWEKDQDTLIKSLLYLNRDFHVILVGDGIRRHELELLTKENGLSERVHFLGLRSDVPAILKSSDFIVMSSHFEGLSLSSIEGMAVRKPMIASNVDGLKQVVEGAGILFPEGNSKELAAIISKLNDDSDFYNRIAESCGNRACEYDISKMVEGYKSVYLQLSDKSKK